MTEEEINFFISQPQWLVNPQIQKLLSLVFDGLAGKMFDIIVTFNLYLPPEKVHNAWMLS